MDISGQLVGLGDDDGEALDRALGRILVPALPEAGEGERPVGWHEVEGLLAAGDGLPFVVSRRRDQATPALEGVTEGRFLGNGLGPGVDRLGPERQILRPVRDEPPAEHRQLPAAALADPHHGHGLRRRDVVARREVRSGPRLGDPIEVHHLPPRENICISAAHIF